MQTDSPPAVPLFVAIGFGILAVSTAAIFIRFAQASAPSLVIAAYRLTIASIVLAPAAFIRQRSEILALKRKDLLLAALSGLFLAVHFASWITSLEYTTVASSVVLVSTVPLWVSILAPFTIKERLAWPVLAGMLLALAGSAIVGVSDTCSWSSAQIACPSALEIFGGKSFWGDILALIGAFMGAGYILAGRGLRGRVSLLSYISIVYGIAAVTMILIVLIVRLPIFGYSEQTYLWLVLLALVPQLLGHSTFNWALRYLSAALVAITLLGEPIGSTILAYFLLHEMPTPLKIIGAILILFGIVIASVPRLIIKFATRFPIKR